ncbi:hypothetical protein [Flavobacterium restrictum]|nr:hypothetical protein [Flavobacterium restrictum]
MSLERYKSLELTGSRYNLYLSSLALETYKSLEMTGSRYDY